MGDRLTQLQDAVDQLAQQMVASFHFVNRRHNLELLSSSDHIRELKPEEDNHEVDPLPTEDFKQGLQELARDLIYKEQQIEYLISMLPGLGSDEKTQEQSIKELDAELKIAETRRQDAIQKKDAVQAELDAVLRAIRRPR